MNKTDGMAGQTIKPNNKVVVKIDYKRYEG